jgi:hypothetical protein
MKQRNLAWSGRKLHWKGEVPAKICEDHVTCILVVPQHHIGVNTANVGFLSLIMACCYIYNILRVCELGEGRETESAKRYLGTT